MPFLLHFKRYSLPFRVPMRTGHGPWINREGILVRAEADGGAVGYGEAAPVPGFGAEDVEADEVALRELGASISAEDLARVPVELGCLRCALTEALNPCPSRRRQAFGGQAGQGQESSGTDRHLPVAALLPAGRPALAALEPKADAGFRTFKWKVGVGDLAEELDLLDDLCGGLPSGARLRLDANGAWNRKQAERWLERCAERPVEFVEQPSCAKASEGAALVRRSEDLLFGLAGDFPTPIALDESLVNEGDIARWIDAGWPGLFVIKPSLLGGPLGAGKLLVKVMDRVVFSSALETAVGAKSALRVAFDWTRDLPSDSKPRALGFGVWPLFTDSRFDGPRAAPFLYERDLDSINPEAVWNALS